MTLKREARVWSMPKRGCPVWLFAVLLLASVVAPAWLVHTLMNP